MVRLVGGRTEEGKGRRTFDVGEVLLAAILAGASAGFHFDG